MAMAGYWDTIITAQVDGTAVTAAAATSLLPAQAKKTTAANYFAYAGQQLIIEASGKISSLITTPGTARFDIRLGGTVVWDGLAILLDSVAAHSNVGWFLRVALTLRTVGSAASFIGTGIWTCEDIIGVAATMPKANAVAILPWNAPPAVGATFDSTVSNVLDLQFTQTVATGTITLQTFSAYSPN